MSIDSHSNETEVNIALLRGINVGGKNKLSMKDLAAMFVDAGCEDVRTYIQSGNVIFTAGPALAEGIPSLIGQLIMDRFGYSVPVVVRTASELLEIVEANPFAQSEFEANRLLVFFMADLPDRARVESLDPDRSPGDEFAVVGREVFVHYPNGVARSKLTNAYFDSRLATTSTGRNWRTVNRLLEMAAAVG